MNQITFGGGTSGLNAATTLRFLTASAVNTTTGTERLRITSTGLVQVGKDNQSSTTFTQDLDIRGRYVNAVGDFSRLMFRNSTDSGNSSASIRAQRTGDNYGTELSFFTQASGLGSGGDGLERLRISSTGNVSIGNNATPDTLLHLQGDTPKLRIESTNTLEASLGTEEIGRIEFEGTKGSNRNVAASLRVRQDGTWSTVDDWFSPTAIEFYTQDQSGTEITTPRLTINRDGEVGINIDAPETLFHVENDNAHGSTYWLNTDAAILVDNKNASGKAVIKLEHDAALVYGSGSSSFIIADRENPRLQITSGGNVNIGGDYTQTTYTMKVTGSFAATTKSFVIDHPTKENHQLRYACLEGPENSVYVRGKTSDSVIELPDYWQGLVHDDSITVNVTPIGNHKVWVESINNNSITIGSDGSEYFYTVFAERKDVDKLEVEVAK